MELKTKIDAEDGKQDLVISREFDLPLALPIRSSCNFAVLHLTEF